MRDCSITGWLISFIPSHSIFCEPEPLVTTGVSTNRAIKREELTRFRTRDGYSATVVEDDASESVATSTARAVKDSMKPSLKVALLLLTLIFGVYALAATIQPA